MIDVSRDYFGQNEICATRLLDDPGFNCSHDASWIQMQQCRDVIRWNLIPQMKTNLFRRHFSLAFTTQRRRQPNRAHILESAGGPHCSSTMVSAPKTIKSEPTVFSDP